MGVCFSEIFLRLIYGQHCKDILVKHMDIFLKTDNSPFKMSHVLICMYVYITHSDHNCDLKWIIFKDIHIYSFYLPYPTALLPPPPPIQYE